MKRGASAESSSRWLLGLTLLGAMAAAPLVTTGVSALTPVLTSEFRLSRAEVGLFAFTVYLVTAFLSVLAGRLMDRFVFGSMLTLNYGLALVALLTVGFATSVEGLFVGAAVGGAAMACSNPLTNRMVGVLVESRRQGAMIATKQVGVQLAQLFTATVFPTLAVVWSWRSGFYVAAALVLLGWVLSLFMALPRLQPLIGREAAGRDGVQVQSRDVPGVGLSVGLLSGSALLFGVSYLGVAFALPLFAYEALGLNAGMAALSVGLLGFVGIVSRVFWGVALDRVDRPAVLLAGMSVASVIAILLLWAASAMSTAWFMWLGIVLYAASGSASPVVLSALGLKRASAHNVGVIAGRISFGMFLGCALGPAMFGFAAQLYGYSVAWLLLGAIASIAPVWIWRSTKSKRIRRWRP